VKLSGLKRIYTAEVGVLPATSPARGVGTLCLSHDRLWPETAGPAAIRSRGPGTFTRVDVKKTSSGGLTLLAFEGRSPS